MTVVISMLRAVNVGAHNRIKMEDLRALYVSVGFPDAQTCLQTGNVIFRIKGRDLAPVTKRIESGIERGFGVRPQVIVRTASELRDVIARNPFARRPGVDPSRLLVTFLSAEPDAEARDKVIGMKIEPEELRIDGRELYIYYPNGMGRPTVPLARIEKTLGVPGTGRNWNTVRKLLEMAEKLEAVVG